MNPAQVKRRLGTFLSYLFLISILVVVIVPFYWMIAASFRQEDQILRSSVTLLPSEPTLASYRHLFAGLSSTGISGKPVFQRWFLNSVTVATGTTLLGLLICSMAGFAFAKFSFWGRNGLFAVILGSALVPQIVTIVPMFMLMSRLRSLNSYQVLIIPPAVSAFGVFYMRQSIIGIPDDLLDAAYMDGCGPFRIYRSIIVPLSRPSLAVLAITLFLGSWISFLWPLIMARTGDMFTLPVGLAGMYGAFGEVRFGPVMAGATLATLPLLLLVMLAQRHFIRGLMQGAIR